MDITEKKEITFYVVYKFLHIFNEILKNKLLLLSSCRVSAKSQLMHKHNNVMIMYTPRIKYKLIYKFMLSYILNKVKNIKKKITIYTQYIPPIPINHLLFSLGPQLINETSTHHPFYKLFLGHHLGYFFFGFLGPSSSDRSEGPSTSKHMGSHLGKI